MPSAALSCTLAPHAASHAALHLRIAMSFVISQATCWKSLTTSEGNQVIMLDLMHKKETEGCDKPLDI